MANRLIRIIGVGNPLMGDDGVGVRVIEELQKKQMPASVEIIDGGCGGLKLLPLFTECQHLIIVDAADFAAQPGDIKILNHSQLHLLPASAENQSGHHFGLPEVLVAAQKLKQLPPLTLFLMQIESCHPGNSLSAEVASALPSLVKKIVTTIR